MPRPPTHRDHAAGLAVAVVLHAGLLFLLLTAPHLVSNPGDATLRVFDVPPPRVSPPPLALPAEPVPQPTAVTDAGGGRRGAEPVRLDRPAPAPVVVPDTTPVIDASAIPIAIPIGSVGVQAGGDNGMGHAGQGRGLGTGVGDGDGASGKAVKWARTEWIATPRTRDFYANWPRDALNRGQSGQAMLSCRITPTGRARGCTVFSESPAGAGFGAAAIAMSSTFRIKPVQRDGRDFDMPVMVPLNFRYSIIKRR